MNKDEFILPNSIKSILSKYYDGLTTLEEERLIKKYFAENRLPDSLLADQAVLSLEKQDDFALFPNNDLWDVIRQNELKQSKYRKTVRLAASIAASVLIILSVGIGYYITSEKQDFIATDTYSNPEEAYKVVQKYLGFASAKLSYAYTEIKPIEKLSIPGNALNSFSDIDKKFQYLNGLNKLNSPSKELERFSRLNDILRINDNN